MRDRRTILVTATTTLIIFCCSTSIGSVSAQNSATSVSKESAEQDSNVDKTQSKEETKKVPFTYGPKTTRYSEPLRDDGRVDYIRILNRRRSDEVKADSNFAIPLIKAFGGVLDRQLVDQECQMIGIPVPESDAPRYQSLDKFLGEKGVEWKEANELYNRIQSKPWNRKEYPDANAWLEKNEVHLDLLLKSSKLPQYYMPRRSADDLSSVLIPDVPSLREVARAFICRAQLRLAEGEYEKALTDILAIEQLARKLDKGSFLVERLASYSLREMYVQVVIAYLEEVPVEEFDHTAMLNLLKEQPVLEPLTASLDDERLVLLDILQFLAIYNEMPSHIQHDRSGATERVLALVRARNIVDWDLAMEEANKEFDELIEILKKPTYAERRRALEQYGEKLNGYTQETQQIAENPLALAQLFLAGQGARKKATKTFVHTLSALLLPATETYMEAHLRTQTQQDCLKIAVAVHAFQAKNDRYPESLDELVPTFLADLPKDAITNQAYLFDKDEAGFAVYTLGPNGKKDLGPAGEITPQNDDWGVAIQVKK